MKCTKCIMPGEKPGFSVDERGICNACQAAEENDRINRKLRWEKLEKIANQARVKKPDGYNVVIPVSGGKDSTFLAMTAKNRLGLNPLCVNVRPCVPTERGKRNLENLSMQGFDVFSFIPNLKIMRKLVKKSLHQDGDPCTSHEFVLYSVPVRMAMQYKIPLIIWAENPSVIYGNPDGLKDASEQKNIGGLWGRDAKHWVCNGVTEQDLISFQHPTAQEIKDVGVKAIYLSDYILWDSRKIAKFAVEHGLETRSLGADSDILHPNVEALLRCENEELLGTGGYQGFEQLDDEFPVIGHLLKFYKFGYGRGTDHACRDIRAGYLTREEGLELAKRYDGHINRGYIERFCQYIAISESDFWKVCETFRNKPVKFD